MSARVSFEELLTAFDWVSAGDAAALDCSAYVSKRTGKVHWVGDGVDEESPEDIEDGSVYVAVPHKSELDLARSLALRFVEAHLPRSYETVYQYFRKRGAYSRFKALLERAGQLEAWHRYEQNAVEEALRQWCEEQGLTPARVPG
jgi:hypothetical protein